MCDKLLLPSFKAYNVAGAMMEDLANRGIEHKTPEWEPKAFFNSATNQT